MSKIGDQYSDLKPLAVLNSQDQAKPPLNYMEVYASLFEPVRFEALTILEIGFSRGRGARTLAEYFHRSQIHCADFEKHICQPYYDAFPDALKARVKLHQCDQSKKDDLTALIDSLGRTMFQIILDDGSHFADDQIMTFNTMWPRLSSGGYYVIEDMHCSYKEGKHKTIEHFKALVDVVNLKGDIKTGKKEDTYIEWIMFPFNRIVVRKK
jgi:hypothetical protein